MFVSNFSIWVSTAKERYNKAKKILEQSKDDPPEEPYRSKYLAKELLTRLREENDGWSGLEIIQVKLISALLDYEIAVISIETDETTEGCELLNATLAKIEDISDKPECCYLTLCILNQLGILWSARGDFETSIKHLKDAEAKYLNYKANCEVRPFDFDDIFTMESGKDDWSHFEKCFTLILFYLAQVYQPLEERDKSAKYCQATLKRQFDSGEFDRSEWAINCAELAGFYTGEKSFQQARHLLCCAAHILHQHEIEADGNIEENREAWMQVLKHKAAISTCWITYSLAVLDDLSGSVNDPEFEPLIQNDDISAMEKRIPSTIKSYDEAKGLFLFAQDHMSIAKSFFTLKNFANSHVQIVQDHSKLFGSLARRDPDVSRRCKMQKRRHDMLEDVLSKLNPQFYLSVCQQLQFELGEICHEMVELKIEIGNSTPRGLSVKAAEKINSWIMKAIRHFEDFINSLRDRDKKLPEMFSDDTVRPALIAHFYIGKYYSKIIEGDTNKKLHNLSKNEEFYKFIVNYVEKNPEHVSFIPKEFPVIEEMLKLLPEKMALIAGSTMF